MQTTTHIHTALLTPDQLAKRWQVTTMTLRRWRKAGKIQVHHLGRLVCFSLADVEKIGRVAELNG